MTELERIQRDLDVGYTVTRYGTTKALHKQMLDDIKYLNDLANNNEVLGDVSYYYLADGDITATGDEYYDYDDGSVWKKLTDADEPHEFESEFHYRTRRKV